MAPGKLNSLCSSFQSGAINMSVRSGVIHTPGRADNQKNLALMALALFCAVMPLEISHLLAALVGAACYFGLTMLKPTVERPKGKISKLAACSMPAHRSKVPGRDADTSPPWRVARPRLVVAATALGPKPSVVPVLAPNFSSTGFEREVEELLGQIVSTPESDEVVSQIAHRVKKSIWGIIPEVEVAGYASGNVLSGAAFGVAVPEVDIVISVSPHVLASRLQGRWVQGNTNASRLDARKLQKSAIRACTDRLVGTGAFKFRRSAFRGDEPKVTLVALAAVGSSGLNVPVNISVNAVTPMHSAALITECGQKDPRAKELILLVRRWAKDRGISHVAKGNLSPYAWTLLALYFLQVDAGEEGPLLPALEAFAMSSGLVVGTRKERNLAAPVPCGTNCNRSVASLFRDFVRFYSKEFSWCDEGISVRLAQRAAPDVSVPLHIILKEDGTGKDVAPSIEDPFETGCNLASCMTTISLKRLHEEFERAHEMNSLQVSLSLLLEPWSPPTETKETDDCDVHED